MSSHGYNYYERDRDRNHILANILKDSDPRVRLVGPTHNPGRSTFGDHGPPNLLLKALSHPSLPAMCVVPCF